MVVLPIDLIDERMAFSCRGSGGRLREMRVSRFLYNCSSRTLGKFYMPCWIGLLRRVMGEEERRHFKGCCHSNGKQRSELKWSQGHYPDESLCHAGPVENALGGVS